RASAVRALIGLLEEGDLVERDAAVHALRSIGPPARSAADALWKTLRSSLLPACLSAPHALVAILREEAVPDLVEALNGAGPRAEIIRALGTLGPRARAALPCLEAM